MQFETKLLLPFIALFIHTGCATWTKYTIAMGTALPNVSVSSLAANPDSWNKQIVRLTGTITHEVSDRDRVVVSIDKQVLVELFADGKMNDYAIGDQLTVRGKLRRGEDGWHLDHAIISSLDENRHARAEAIN